MMACALGEIILGIRLESILTPESRIAMVFSPLGKMPIAVGEVGESEKNRASALLADGALQGTVERRLRLLIFIWRDLGLDASLLDLDQFFLEPIQHERRRIRRSGGRCGQRRRSGASHGPC